MVGHLKGTDTELRQERKHDGGYDRHCTRTYSPHLQVLVLCSDSISNIKSFSVHAGVFINDYHYLMGGGSGAFIKELHGSHVSCACNGNDCNDSIICIYYHEQKVSP